MMPAFRSLLSRPLESLLLVLTLTFGAALTGLVLCAAWPSLGSTTWFSPGLDGRELSVQTRDDDYSQFYRTPGAPPVARVGRVGDKPITLQLADLRKLQTVAPAIQYSYLADYASMGDYTKQLEVKMVTSDYFGALGAATVQGALPNAAEYRQHSRVVVLTEYAARKLFPGKPALGQSVEGYRVIGVLRLPKDDVQFRSAKNTEYGPLGFVPHGAMPYQQPLQSMKFLAYRGREAEGEQQLGAALQNRWGDRVTISSNAAQSAEYGKQARRGALALSLLGVLGLLVASLSVLALLLARVLSRQRQLGMAAALGATRARIRGQYLLEVLLLGLLGSLLGGGLAVGLLAWLSRGADPRFGGGIAAQPVPLLLTTGGTLLLSLLFGLLPAIQASQVRPAEALRA